MIYMFILIRTGIDRKERDKIGFFVIFIKSTQGMTEKKKAQYFHRGSYDNVLHFIMSGIILIIHILIIFFPLLS